MSHRIYLVDVFAERPYAGNPLAVVVGDESMADETMQQIAAEMNFSETTFVSPVPEGDGGYRVRVFTPSREIEFTGHPILGTAWVIREHLAADKTNAVKLNLLVGPVTVTFEQQENGKDIAWFQAPSISLGQTVATGLMAPALGLNESDIDGCAPVQMVSAGTSAMMVPIRNMDALERAQLNLQAYAGLSQQGYPPLTYLFCRETRDVQNDLSVRFFFEAHGVREDPATGNGAAFLGAYLLEHNVFNSHQLQLRIEQGHGLRRPSLIRLRAGMYNDIAEVHVGGGILPTVKGELV